MAVVIGAPERMRGTSLVRSLLASKITRTSCLSRYWVTSRPSRRRSLSVASAAVSSRLYLFASATIPSHLRAKP